MYKYVYVYICLLYMYDVYIFRTKKYLISTGSGSSQRPPLSDSGWSWLGARSKPLEWANVWSFKTKQYCFSTITTGAKTLTRVDSGALGYPQRPPQHCTRSLRCKIAIGTT